MDRKELTELLQALAQGDLSEGHDIHDHPCSVAVRAIDKCFDDIATLKSLTTRRDVINRSKSVQHLVGLSYSPSW